MSQDEQIARWASQKCLEAMTENQSSEYQRGYEAGLEAAARHLDQSTHSWSEYGLKQVGILRAWLVGKAELLAKEAAAIRALPRKG